MGADTNTPKTRPYFVMVCRTHSSSVFFAPIFHFSAAAERRVTEGRSRDMVQPSVHEATEKGESLLGPASCSISWLRRSSWRVFSSIWGHGQAAACTIQLYYPHTHTVKAQRLPALDELVVLGCQFCYNYMNPDLKYVSIYEK